MSENIDDISEVAAAGITVGIILPMLLIGFGLVIWNIVLLFRMWNTLEGWAKVLYLFLLLSGVGPVPGIILLYMNVGVQNK